MADYSSRFKNINGLLYTKRLFYEMVPGINDLSSTYYTLKDKDITVNDQVFISLYPRYLELEDVTEFEFANAYFDSYEHFQILCDTEWFKDHISRWRKELDLKLRGQALKRIQQVASNAQDKNYFEANKIIMKGEYKAPTKSSRGRPSKSEISKAADKIAKEDLTIASDFNRIING